MGYEIKTQDERVNEFFKELFAQIEFLNRKVIDLHKRLDSIKKYAEDVQGSGMLEFSEQDMRVRRLLNDIMKGRPTYREEDL